MINCVSLGSSFCHIELNLDSRQFVNRDKNNESNNYLEAPDVLQLSYSGSYPGNQMNPDPRQSVNRDKSNESNNYLETPDVLGLSSSWFLSWQ